MPSKPIFVSGLFISAALIWSAALPPQQKLIALTYDDGPRPYILLGDGESNDPTLKKGLLGVLERHNVKATFFIMGWRLADKKNPDNLKAVQIAHRKGNEIENHTYGHGAFRNMTDRYGEKWVLDDIEKASGIIQSVTGRRPIFVRPPEWSIWKNLRSAIENKEYRVVTKSVADIKEPALTADVDVEDYRLYEKVPSQTKVRELEKTIMKKIAARERSGIYGHVLVLHELPVSVLATDLIIPLLKKKGYQFVRLDEYMENIKNKKPASAMGHIFSSLPQIPFLIPREW